MSARHAALLGLFALSSMFFLSCSRDASGSKAQDGKKRVVVTYSILASVAREIAGEGVEVEALIPNGLDVHEWEPSARDVESLMKADLLVMNGLGLEGGMEKALARAREGGVRCFIAADHIVVRRVGEGEGIPAGTGAGTTPDPDQVAGAEDPHLWTDPLAMKAVADALALELKADFGIETEARAAAFDAKLIALDAEIRDMTAGLSPERRRIVTGHESLGYFAQRYGYKLVGALVPSLSSEAQASAAWLSSLKKLIAENKVPVIFTEVGSSPQIVASFSKETGARAIPLATHLLPADGSYVSFERELARTIVEGLR